MANSTRWLLKHHFGLCRAITGHTWQLRPLLSQGNAIKLQLACANCGAKRIDLLNASNGVLLKRHYVHAKGYLFDLQGKAKPSTATLRLEWLNARSNKVSAIGSARKRRRAA